MGESMEKTRKLAGIELGLAISNEFSAFNAVIVIRIQGKLEPGKLRDALAALQQRHPLLRARLFTRKGAYYFAWDNVGPVPIEIKAKRSSDDWMVATEDQLNNRMDVAAGPLLRCVYLQDSDEKRCESELILTFNHTILDAASAQPLLRELLEACAGEKAVPGPEITEEGTLPAVALFPRKVSGIGFAGALGGYMARQMADEGGYQWRARKCRKPPINDSGRNRVLPLRLEKPLTDALIRATRRQRVTMNSILGAGLALATKRHLYPSIDTPFRSITFADLRPYERETLPEGTLGCHMGMCRLTVQMSDKTDFWNLARVVNDGIYRSNRRGERFLTCALVPGMMKMFIGMQKMRMGTTALSYAGPVSVGQFYGTIRVHGLHAFTTNMTIGPEFSALSRLFLGEIWLDLLYIDSDMDSAMAERIAEEMRQILKDAAGKP